MFNDLDDFTETQAAFMEVFLEATSDFGDGINRIWDDVAKLELTNWASDHGVDLGDDELYLAGIEVEEFGKGYAGAALDWLFSLADEFGITFKLHSDLDESKLAGSGDGITEQKHLDKMYLNRGCQRLGDNGFMGRWPR